MECFQGSYCLPTRELCSLSKASAKVRQFFKLQNFFATFFQRFFRHFRHCAEHQTFEQEKIFQLFENIFTNYRQMQDLRKNPKEKRENIFIKQT